MHCSPHSCACIASVTSRKLTVKEPAGVSAGFTAERSRLFDGFIMLDCFVLEYGALCASEGVGDLHQKSLLHSLSITFSLSLSSAVVARSESLCLKLTLWSPSVMLATVCAASVEPGCCVR